MNSLKNKIRSSLVILIVVALGSALVFWVFKPTAVMADRSVDFKGSSSALMDRVQKADTDWSGKIVEIKGNITSKDRKGVILDQGVYCQLIDSTMLNALNKGMQIQLKGIVLGYDELYDELKLAQCILK